ncbi:MAG: CRISPR-associated protein Cas4 [Chloroflexi bacterium]|nr:CRISPR-associated protein Cas4 [Chloroflexota bacterium]
MNDVQLPDYLPISHINAYSYCSRRFWIEFVQADMLVNELVLEGQMQHERVDRPGSNLVDGEATYRRVFVFSERLRIAGISDLVEEVDGELRPVEYKHGRLGKWLNDHLQLCAQALCLEERTGRAIREGAIFYHGSRRREYVALNADLRARTEATIAAMWQLLTAGRIPPPIDHPAKCTDCSVEPLCLPREVLFLNDPQAGLHRAASPRDRSHTARARLPQRPRGDGCDEEEE